MFQFFKSLYDRRHHDLSKSFSLVQVSILRRIVLLSLQIPRSQLFNPLDLAVEGDLIRFKPFCFSNQSNCCREGFRHSHRAHADRVDCNACPTDSLECRIVDHRSAGSRSRFRCNARVPVVQSQAWKMFSAIGTVSIISFCLAIQFSDSGESLLDKPQRD